MLSSPTSSGSALRVPMERFLKKTRNKKQQNANRCWKFLLANNYESRNALFFESRGETCQAFFKNFLDFSSTYSIERFPMPRILLQMADGFNLLCIYTRVADAMFLLDESVSIYPSFCFI